ncbi:hypothetical protein HWV62_11411 [Athelia sp. TMB]|nr:hypothetical protein HWV62_11411 [Athelia sp. TMB]
MRTRSGRVRSSSLPPPASPMVNVEVSEPIDAIESTDTWSGPSAPVPSNEPAVETLSLVEAVAHVERVALERSSPALELEQDKEESGSKMSVDLLDDGDRDVVRQQDVDNDGFVTPTRSARVDDTATSHNSSVSGSSIFPEWFREPMPIDNPINQFDWGNSTDEDELPDISNWQADAQVRQTQQSIADVFGSAESNDILNKRMMQISKVRADHTENESSDDDHTSSNSESPSLKRKRRSVFGQYKRPKRPSRSRSPGLSLRATMIAEDGPSACQKCGKEGHSTGECRLATGEGVGNSYLAKGKYKALSEDDVDSEIELRKAQIEADREAARALQHRLDAENVLPQSRRREIDPLARHSIASRTLASRNAKIMALEQRIKELEKQQGGTHRNSLPEKSATPGTGGTYKRASSRLPMDSSMKQAMAGYPDDSPSSSEPSSRDSSPVRDKARKHKGSDASDSGNSSGNDLFNREPESDHPSDSSGAKRRKREKRRRYRAKLNELKYQQPFLKQDPPETYDGSVIVTKIKKWFFSIQDLKRNGHLRTQQIIRLSGKYMSGKAYRFFEQNVLQKRKKYNTLTEYFEELFDYIFPPGFRMQQRDKFDRFEQLSLPAVDFLRRLQEIGDTIGDITDKDVVLAFWQRCAPYLRSELILRGYDASEITISELEDLVIRVERAHQEARGTTREATSRLQPPNNSSKRHIASSAVTVPSRRPEPQTATRAVGQRREGFKSKGTAETRTSKPASAEHRTHDAKAREQDRQRINRLREENKCFLCESPDHIGRNCPKRHNQRPPLRSNAIGLSATEIQLAALEEGTSLGLFSIGDETHLLHVECVSRTDEHRRAEREVLWARALGQLYNAVPLAYDLLEGWRISPYAQDRFVFHEYGGIDTYLLRDSHTYGEYVLARELLVKPDFDLLRWLNARQGEQLETFLREPRLERVRALQVMSSRPKSPMEWVEPWDDQDDVSCHDSDVSYLDLGAEVIPELESESSLHILQ